VAEAGETILNCNDDPANRYVISRALRQSGYQVYETVTGAETLEAVRRVRPALVVLDVKLPDISGIEVCRQLKAAPETASIPVLHTSASLVTAAHRVEGLDSGADGYLVQPIEGSVLSATVRALLRACKAERDVRQVLATWQTTFDAIADAVAIVALDGTILQANGAMLHRLDITAANAVGRPCSDLIEGRFGIAVAPLLTRVVASGGREMVEALDGTGWVRIAVDRVDDGGAGIRLVVTLTDITDLKRLEQVQRARAEELAAADRRKDEFLAMLAHELRNPLNAIATANGLHERVEDDREQSARLRGIIARQTRHLARLVDDLLEVSRITRGEVHLQRTALDVRTTIEAAVQSLEASIQARGQRVDVQLPEEPVAVEGDLLRLEQALVNIIANASKYSDPGGRIEVRLHVEAGSAVIRVGDEGIGIAPDQLDAIFDLFVQVDDSLARSVGGLGLGLTIARRLVELHGGTITAESAGLGAGAAFTVRLPLVSDTRAVAAPIPALGDTGRASRPLDVLVIEDNNDTRELMKRLVESWGHHVAVAADGATGLAAALERRPDVALIDIGLPGLDGYQLARTLRASRSADRMVLVALTGYGRPEDSARALDCGFDLHLVKPIDPERLQQLLLDPEAVRSARGGERLPS
jgi:signal transduction histidine kinase